VIKLAEFLIRTFNPREVSPRILFEQLWLRHHTTDTLFSGIPAGTFKSRLKSDRPFQNGVRTQSSDHILFLAPPLRAKIVRVLHAPIFGQFECRLLEPLTVIRGCERDCGKSTDTTEGGNRIQAFSQ